MSYQINQETGEITIGGFEQGIATSPLKGIANLQNVNIATETGEVMASLGRVQQSMTNAVLVTGTLTFSDSTHVALNINGTNNYFKGMWIAVSFSSHTGELPNGTYYVRPSSGGGFQLSSYYNSAVITGFTAGLTATIVLYRNMKKPIAYAIEPYSASYFRYYVLDSTGLVWMYDTANEVTYSSADNVNWVLPDYSLTYFGSDTTPSGIAVLNGWLMVFSGNKIWVKPTVNLGGSTSTATTYVQMTSASLVSKSTTTNPHYAITSKQGSVYYTDGNYVGKIFPDTSLLSGTANVQSYASYTASTTTGTISSLIGGSIPSNGFNVGATGHVRIPAVFFTSQGGTLPTDLSADTVFYIAYSTSNENFQVYDALTGGVLQDIETGSAGTQYFNTFYPVGTHTGAYGDTTTMVFSPERLNLPYGETGKSLVEIGNTVLVGTQGSVVYPWNQVDLTPSGLINLPEADVQQMLTVNQMAYIFAGYKGNIYITDGSVASLLLKVPDYCAGIAGTMSTYWEPTFTWGGVMYLKGRVYFSILDQVSTNLYSKDGNCGGIWSFYPTQNLYYGQDTGLALRQENISSYATYNGVCTVLIPHNNQNIRSPQYWSGWWASITGTTYGIDFTGTQTVSNAIIETDLVPVGTVKNKRSFREVEYKLSAPLTSGESVTCSWRANSTDAFTAMPTAITESATALSGYFTVNLQGFQWLQLQVTLVQLTAQFSSKIRLAQIIVR